MEYFKTTLTEEERFLRTLLLLGALLRADDEGTATYRTPEPPKTPYQGYEGQRPGESYTAYRIRVRKEQQA